jgi:drug/metabolite transporter (DMT)-like permease
VELMMDLKSIAIYLPIMAAFCWAVVYTVNARNYEVISVPTGLMAQGLGMLGASFLASFLLKTPIDFTPFFNHPQKIWFWVVPVTVIFASCFLHLSLKYNSATYTGLVEILYVILIPMFAYLLFGQKQVNLSMLIGGALMLSGIGFVVYGQMQKS